MQGKADVVKRSGPGQAGQGFTKDGCLMRLDRETALIAGLAWAMTVLGLISLCTIVISLVVGEP